MENDQQLALSVYINITPTWEGVMPILLETIHHADARTELMRLARMVDRYNSESPKLLAAIESGDYTAAKHILENMHEQS